MISVDVAVVGGGPAGAATACGLAAAGREVLLLERAAEPHHKVCGEFISWDTAEHLARLGLDARRLGAVALDRFSMSNGSRHSHVTLPFPAWSLSRFRLDEAVLKAAARYGAQIRTGVSIRSASALDDGWELRGSDGSRIRCRRLVAATGKLGLRGIEDGRDRSMVGLKIHLRLADGNTRALLGMVDLVLLRCGYAGLELVENGIANLCVLIRKDAIARLGPGWPVLYEFLKRASPCLAQRLADASALWETPLAVACPAGGDLHPHASRFAPATYPVGDRLAHVPPFTGDGLAFALGSAALAVAHISRGSPAAAYVHEARRLTASALRLGRAVSRLAATHSGRAVLVGTASYMPAVLRTIARRTRLPFAA